MDATSIIHACPSSVYLVRTAAIRCTVSAPQQKSKETRLEEFGTWLKGMGHEPCNLRLRSFPSESETPGTGAIAKTGGIRKGQIIVQVPFQAFMSEQTARACPHVGPLIEKAGLTEWQSLCLHLLCERAKGVRSMWYPYLALLPTESEMAELHPLMWPQGLSEEWLSGSPMLLKLQQRFLNCREDYEALVAAGSNFLFPPEKSIDAIVTEISTRWAASILLSRAFSLDLTNELDDDEFSEHSTVLVPWADMLNHSSLCGKESCLVYDSIKKVACLHASKDYLEGEQVFDSYGPNLSPSDLLLDYGFVDQENNNHRVDLPASCLGPVTGSANDDLLRSIGLPPDGAIFSITEDGVDETALAWTRAAVASIKELASVGWTEGKHSQEEIDTRGNLSMARFLKPVNHENESEVMRRLLSACGNVLTQYQTTLDEGHAMVDNEVDKVKVSWAQAQAKLAITSEKKALRGTWKQFYVKLKKLENGGNFRRSSKIKRTN